MRDELDGRGRVAEGRRGRSELRGLRMSGHGSQRLAGNVSLAPFTSLALSAIARQTPQSTEVSECRRRDNCLDVHRDEGGDPWLMFGWRRFPSLATTILALVAVIALPSRVASESAIPYGRLSESYRAAMRTGNSLSSLSFSPDSENLAYMECAPSQCWINIVNVSTRQSHRITAPPIPNSSKAGIASYSYPVFHPDGKHLAFTKYQKVNIFDKTKGGVWSIALASLEGQIVAETKPDRLFKAYPMFFPDGKSYIYSGAGTPPGEDGQLPRERFIFKSSFPSGQPTRVLDSYWSGQFILKSLSGKNELIFWAFSLTPAVAAARDGLYKANLNDGTVQLIIKNEYGGGVGSPNQFPNGDLLYTLRTDNRDGKQKGNYVYDLFRKGPKGERRLTTGLGYVKKLALSPNGSMIAAIITAPGTREETLSLLPAEGR